MWPMSRQRKDRGLFPLCVPTFPKFVTMHIYCLLSRRKISVPCFQFYIHYTVLKRHASISIAFTVLEVSSLMSSCLVGDDSKLGLRRDCYPSAYTRLLFLAWASWGHGDLGQPHFLLNAQSSKGKHWSSVHDQGECCVAFYDLTSQVT